ncbi:MAG: hypothetical protein ACP5HW_02970 [Candidatus Micrarchaeia archaeon]
MKAQTSLEMLLTLSLSLLLFSILFSYTYTYYSRLQSYNLSRSICMAQSAIEWSLNNGHINEVENC